MCPTASEFANPNPNPLNYKLHNFFTSRQIINYNWDELNSKHPISYHGDYLGHDCWLMAPQTEFINIYIFYLNYIVCIEYQI